MMARPARADKMDTGLFKIAGPIYRGKLLTLNNTRDPPCPDGRAGGSRQKGIKSNGKQ